MTESEYITVKDLGQLRCAIESLRLIIPEVSDIIDKDEYVMVMSKIREWEEKHFENIKIKSDEK